MSPRVRFRTSAVQALSTLLKPDGFSFGMLAAAVIISSASWTFTLHSSMRIPNLLWTWDHNVLARGMFSVVEFALWCIYSAIAYDLLDKFKSEAIRCLQDHLSSMFFAGVLTVPLAFLLWEEMGKHILAATLLLPVGLAVADAIRALYRKLKLQGTYSHCLRRIRRSRASDFRKHMDRQIARSMSRNLIVGAPLILFFATFVYYGVIDSLEYTIGKQPRIVFPQQKGVIAVFRSGEYWIVKSTRRHNDILVVEESSSLVKLDDPKYSSARITEIHYGLRMGGRQLENRIGAFGAALVHGSGSQDIE